MVAGEADVPGFLAKSANSSLEWLGRTSFGVHRESTASCSCSGSRFPKRPCPATLRPCTEVPGNRGGRLFAIKRSPSDIRTILSTPTKTWRSRPECSDRVNLTRFARQIARLDTGDRRLPQPRGIAAPLRLRARSASLRTFRYSIVPKRSSTAGANPVSVSVRMRGPPRHTARFLKAGASRKVCGPSFEKGQGYDR